MGRMSVDRESMRAATACLVRCLARGRGCKRGTGAGVKAGTLMCGSSAGEVGSQNFLLHQIDDSLKNRCTSMLQPT